MPAKRSNFATRSAPAKRPNFTTRSVSAGQRLASLNEADRSVEFVATTSDKVQVFDWDTWRPVDEVLLMSGRVDPPGGQVPLLDSHDNYSVDKQLGSARDIRTEGQATIVRVFISSTRDDVFTKIKEGHLTDCSVGYRIKEFTQLKEGETGEYEGLTVTGPCRVVTSWELVELSLCPIGADPAAKARGDMKKEKNMRKKKGRMEATPAEEQQLEDDLEQAVEETVEAAVEDLKEEIAAVVEEAAGDESPAEEEGEREDGADEEEKEERAAIIRAERRRVGEIEDICRSFGINDQARGLMIKKGLTVDQARKVVMNHMKKSYAAGPAYGAVRVIGDEGEKFRARALDSILLRAGKKVAKPAPGARELQGYTLRELARECLRRSGRPEPANVVEMVGRALTTTDLPILLTEAANRSLLEGFQEAQETWSLWTGEGSVNDFREITMVDVGLDNTLEEIGEHDEYTYTQMAEEAEKARVVTYGRMFAISRQAIINDDLNALTGIPSKMGAGVNKKIGDGVYGVLIANSAMADGQALFSAAHNNLLTGGGVPDVAKLGAADTAMGLQKDMAGNRLNIRPEYFLAPVSLRVASETFFNSEMVGTQAQPTTRNIYDGAFTRIYEPRLDDDSTESWYLSGPAHMGVRVIYLNGVKEPYLETREGWSIDGIEHKVRFDVGVKAVSWRGILKSQS
ncbi:hypothetical protein LJB86_02725 [Deltaproteobacteria bacterium OttesenSCG-928-M10]|nr:hypothetical protein [Deltaproteobacteria bacterium OttesenSCG-928-M10]